MAGPVGMIAGTVLDELINNKLDSMIVPTALDHMVTPSGWTVRTVCNNPIPGSGLWIWCLGVPSLGSPCPTNQSVSPHYFSPEEFIAANPNATVMGHARRNGGTGATQFRVNFWYSWWRNASNPALPAPNLYPLPSPVEVPWPKTVRLPRPDEWPVGLPMPASNPSSRGLAGRTAATPEGRGTDRGPSRNRQPARGPRSNPRRPPKGTKETKKTPRGGLATAVMQGMGRGLSSMSELGDFVDALHEALPKNLQSGKNLGEKMRDLYRHINDIDWEKAVVNLAKNHVEDAIVGGLIGMTTKNMGSHLGNNLVAGPRVRFPRH